MTEVEEILDLEELDAKGLAELESQAPFRLRLAQRNESVRVVRKYGDPRTINLKQMVEEMVKQTTAYFNRLSGKEIPVPSIKFMKRIDSKLTGKPIADALMDPNQQGVICVVSPAVSAETDKDKGGCNLVFLSESIANQIYRRFLADVADDAPDSLTEGQRANIEFFNMAIRSGFATMAAVAIAAEDSKVRERAVVEVLMQRHPELVPLDAEKVVRYLNGLIDLLKNNKIDEYGQPHRNWNTHEHVLSDALGRDVALVALLTNGLDVDDTLATALKLPLSRVGISLLSYMVEDGKVREMIETNIKALFAVQTAPVLAFGMPKIRADGGEKEKLSKTRRRVLA